jgi:hypothetical protein
MASFGVEGAFSPTTGGSAVSTWDGDIHDQNSCCQVIVKVSISGLGLMLDAEAARRLLYQRLLLQPWNHLVFCTCGHDHGSGRAESCVAG